MKEFSVSKGERQGDSLSPFKFMNDMEALNDIMIRAREVDSFHAIQTPNNAPNQIGLTYPTYFM